MGHPSEPKSHDYDDLVNFYDDGDIDHTDDDVDHDVDHSPELQ